MGAGDTFGLFQYQDDTNAVWTVRLSAGTAAVGGFTPWTGDIRPWPYHEKRMRAVTGVDSVTGKGASTPCSTVAAANAILATGSWTNPGTGHLINSRGYRGEHRDARDT